MRRSYKFKSIRSHLACWFLIISMFPLTVLTITIYNHKADSMKVPIFNMLEANRDVKVNELDHWIEEKIIDVRTAAADNDIRILEKVFEIREDNNQLNITIISRAREFLNRYMQNHNDYHEILVVSSHTKKIMVSTNKKNEGKMRINDTHFAKSFQTGELVIEDIHYSKWLNKPCMAFSIPIFSLTGGNRVIGILVARVNLETSLYKLLSDRTGMGKTGETFIVNKDVFALNELRWYENAPLKYKIDSKAAVEAAQGKTGIIEAKDYRGEMALAAYTHIPLTGWGVVAKQDLKEVYAPIYKLRNRTYAFGIITLFIVIIAAFRVSKSIAEPKISDSQHNI